MHDLILQLLAYVRGVWRYRWLLLLSAWAVSLSGWAYVAMMPDQYQASARVYVDTESVLKPLLRGLAVHTNEQRYVSLMTKTLLSRPNLEKVTRMTDLDLKAKSPEEMESILTDLEKKIKLEGTRQVNLYTISYFDHDPELAKLVVKSLLTIFVEGNLGETRKEQDSAHQFLEQQIDDYERRMLEAEKKLTLFKQKNIGYLTGESGGYYTRLEQVRSNLEREELDLKVFRNKLKVLKQQLEGETPTFGLVERENYGSGSGDSALDRRIENLELKLDDLLLHYTDQHPDVITIKKTIETLEAEKAEELEKEEEQPPETQAIPETNVVYQQMKMAYAEAEAEVAAKKARVAEYRQRAEELEAAVDRVLQVEAERAQLNRDYSVLKKNYDAMVASLESARLTRKVDTRADSVRFRVIDPPRVPPTPSGPNRILLGSGVLGGGLVLGLVLALLMSQLRPTFDDRRLMNETTGLPVLGSIDMVWTAAQKKQHRMRGVTFAVTFLMLVAVYGGVMGLFLLDVDLMARVSWLGGMLG